MRAVWVLFLIGCGFQSPTANHNPDAGIDASVPPDTDTVDLSQICPSIALGTPVFHASACATPTRASIEVTASTSIDTDQGNSEPPGLTCDRVVNGDDHLCVLVAPSIIIDPGVVLSAHGSIPFAVFAHELTIRGIVDVASHIGKPAGAGAIVDGCTKGTLPKLSGGGHGGTAAAAGGNGGNDGSQSGTGGTILSSFGIDVVLGGCGGTLGGDGSAGGGDDGGKTTGGAGGGAVWLVSDTRPLLIDAGGAINASGAGGAGGVGGITEGHGGAGGGAGGLIVLQAPSIQLSSSAVVFANGGHGGGGAGTMTGFTSGLDGTDPTGPQSGGGGGTGGADGGGGTSSGDGGPGYPNAPFNGKDGTTAGHGGGGGGGGPGAIRAVSAGGLTGLTGSNVSPPPLLLQ